MNCNESTDLCLMWSEQLIKHCTGQNLRRTWVAFTLAQSSNTYSEFLVVNRVFLLQRYEKKIFGVSFRVVDRTFCDKGRSTLRSTAFSEKEPRYWTRSGENRGSDYMSTKYTFLPTTQCKSCVQLPLELWKPQNASGFKCYSFSAHTSQSLFI